ncbi:MAG: DUF4268 domain-containing protein [Saonia sp.]
MFSKEESKKLRQDFWIAFGKSYPRKWILYQTKIKDFSFKFHFDVKQAMVSLDIEQQDLERRTKLWEKLISLKSILVEHYVSNAIFENSCMLKNEKEISRIYVSKQDVSIHNKDTWRETMEFLNNTMIEFELFFLEYREVITS